MNPEIVGLLAGLMTTGSTVPQIIRSYKLKEAKDLSLLYLSLIVIGITLWLYYGIMMKSVSIITWNIIALALNSLLLAQKVYYDSNSK